MKYNKQEIKEGINLHTIQTNKFKTNLLSVFITMPLLKDTVTKEALIGSVLRRGSKTMPSTEQISINLEEMYGASFDCGIDKIGNKHILKFYLETINDEFLLNKENMLEKAINMLLEIVFNPLTQDDKFKEEYVETEKEHLKQIIDGKSDNKAKYALDRCIEEMYKDKPYGLYKFGYVEELQNITAKELYNYYKEMINQAKIDIFVSGQIDQIKTKELIEQSEIIRNLNQRTITNQEETTEKVKKEIQKVEEKMDVSQGKLVIGLDVNETTYESKYVTQVYNMILGGGANSKLFQNVREKASLAYSTGSNYIRQVNNIFIRCGIEISNYEKALNIINKQIEDMKNGNFTQEELQNAKQNLTSAIKFIPEEQDTGITYYFGQELSNNKTTLEEYAQKIENVTKDQVIEIANSININTIYFLRN